MPKYLFDKHEVKKNKPVETAQMYKKSADRMVDALKAAVSIRM